MQQASPGWYPDPDSTEESERYWNGLVWTNLRRAPQRSTTQLADDKGGRTGNAPPLPSSIGGRLTLIAGVAIAGATFLIATALVLAANGRSNRATSLATTTTSNPTSVDIISTTIDQPTTPPTQDPDPACSAAIEQFPSLADQFCSPEQLEQLGETPTSTLPPPSTVPTTTKEQRDAEVAAAAARRRERERQRAIDEYEEIYGPIGAGEITAAEFNAVQTGMTVDEVRSIIGAPGTVSSEGTIAGTTNLILSWTGVGAPGANAIVQFQNGRVITKAQAGL